MTFTVKRHIERRRIIPGAYTSNGGLVVETDYLRSQNSPRDKTGKLVLRQNPFILLREKETYRTTGYNRIYDETLATRGIAGSPSWFNNSEAHQAAWSKFRSDVHYGNAALGVTFASARQSMNMIAEKMTLIGQMFKKVERNRHYLNMRLFMRETEGKSKKFAKGSANRYLEYIFGWVPLYQDCVSAMEVLTGDHHPRWVKTTSKKSYKKRHFDKGSYWTETETQSANVHVRVSALVSVTNPNLYLANRLGLINPAVVAWDLVPWSFVVNMFGNFNQILNSFTDWVGIGLSDVSTTSTVVSIVDMSKTDSKAGINTSATSGFTRRSKNRTLGGSPPRPKLQLRIPDLNLDLALMATALATQQASRILKLVR